MGIENLIAKLLASGADLSTRSAVRAVLSLMGEDEELADQIYVELKNRAYSEDFAKVPPEKRAVFIPQCLRNFRECPAELGEYGFECTKCGRCPVGSIIEVGERLGYRQFYIAPGGSLVKKILKSKVPKGEIKAAIGIACWPELAEAAEKLSHLRIPLQAVPLLRAGCINTLVDVKRVEEILSLGIMSERRGSKVPSIESSPTLGF
ncbi:hypothetical protein APY94_09250 [Thermococcus celericrescens]|uniref:DUF116 domain-containing protein n=1 Tax=Thermococcus celericrescens TaxID=227598 RepID=A0A117ISZ5_9EURY|nr:DUF116 domain-containing protein [Thermococcus celericrescens]KUH32600.1 hypothetical protein APY94_09250 [Thermococcus celericrescens]